MAGRGFDRSVRRWLRAYPVWWRGRRGEEMLGVLEELADDGARRVDLRTGLGLVRGGWATRWRHRPPWHRFVLYRLGFVNLPEGLRWWAVQDIAGRFFPQRDAAFLLALLMFMVVLPGLWGPDTGTISWWGLVGPGGFLCLTFVPAWGRRMRKLAWDRVLSSRRAAESLASKPGWPVVSARLVPRRRLAARPGLGRAAVVLAFGAVVLPVAAVLAPKRIAHIPCHFEGVGWCAESVIVARAPQIGLALVVWLALAVAAAVALGARAARRVHGAQLPAQPHRDLIVSRVPWASLTAAGAIGALGFAEVTGILVQLFAAPLAVGCIVGLGLVVGQREGLARRVDARDWAVSDAWWVAVSRSGVVVADAPIREAVVPEVPPELSGPAEGPLPS